MSFESRLEYDYQPPPQLLLKRMEEFKQKGFSKDEAEDFVYLLFLPDGANLSETEKGRLAEYKKD